MTRISLETRGDDLHESDRYHPQPNNDNLLSRLVMLRVNTRTGAAVDRLAMPKPI